MNFTELENILLKYNLPLNGEPPLDAFKLSQALNIRVKNSLEAKLDFKTTENPLEKSDGCIAVVNGEYVIYHDEKSPYKNFNVAHELAHYMLHHNGDGLSQHHDANLLAAMMISPVKLTPRRERNHPTRFAEKNKIPIETAQIYLAEIQRDKAQLSKPTLICAITLLSLLCGIFALQSCKLSKKLNQNNYVETNAYLTTPVPSATIPIPDIVYVTAFGTKFHKNDCTYIKGKSNITSLSLDEAQNLGYDYCKVCW